jgi:[ribosomal protein S5]-alanine N-acetyltransferase
VNEHRSPAGSGSPVARPAAQAPADPHVGRRVELRTPSAADRDAYVEAMVASRELHDPWLDVAATSEAFDDVLRRAASEEFEPMLVCRRRDAKIVGFANISQIIRGRLQSGFVGYGGVAGETGKGYMTEALELVVRRAFTELGLHRLEANIQPENAASIALVRRCGFELEGFSPRYLKVGGQWRDHERWAIHAEQWLAGGGCAGP